MTTSTASSDAAAHTPTANDYDALLGLLIEGPVASGALRLEHEGQPMRDPQQLRAMLSDEMERLLKWFAFAAVLVG